MTNKKPYNKIKTIYKEIKQKYEIVQREKNNSYLFFYKNGELELIATIKEIIEGLKK